MSGRKPFATLVAKMSPASQARVKKVLRALKPMTSADKEKAREWAERRAKQEAGDPTTGVPEAKLP